MSSKRPGTVDYSRWDNLSVSDSDEEEEEEDSQEFEDDSSSTVDRCDMLKLRSVLLLLVFWEGVNCRILFKDDDGASDLCDMLPLRSALLLLFWEDRICRLRRP